MNKYIYIWLDERRGKIYLKHGLTMFEQCSVTAVQWTCYCHSPSYAPLCAVQVSLIILVHDHVAWHWKMPAHPRYGTNDRMKLSLLPKSSLVNQWVYWGYFQKDGEGFLTGAEMTPRQLHHQKPTSCYDGSQKLGTCSALYSLQLKRLKNLSQATQLAWAAPSSPYCWYNLREGRTLWIWSGSGSSRGFLAVFLLSSFPWEVPES